MLMGICVDTSVVLNHILVEQLLIGNFPVIRQMIAQSHKLWGKSVLVVVRQLKKPVFYPQRLFFPLSKEKLLHFLQTIKGFFKIFVENRLYLFVLSCLC